MNRLEWFISRRFLFSLRGQRFLFLLTLFGLVLVVGTVALTYTVVSVAESFSNTLRHQLLNARPHIEVTLTKDPDPQLLDRMKRDPELLRLFPYISGTALIKGDGLQEGVQVLGMDTRREGPSQEASQSQAEAFFSAWVCRTLDDAPIAFQRLAETPPRMILGSELYRDLQASIPSSNQLVMMYPMGDVDPFGNSLPVESTFTVEGSCESGVYPIDRKLVIVSAPELRRLLGQYEPTWNRLWIELLNPMHLDGFLKRWGPSLQAFGAVSTWQEMNKTLLGALTLERKVFAAVIAMVFLLASLTLYGMLSLLAIEKRGDFAVLNTLGLLPSQVMGILIRMSTLLAVIGAFVGGALGWVVVAILSHARLPLPEAYYVRELEVAQQPLYLMVIVGLCVGVQIFSAFFPSVWLRKSNPVNALRFVEGGVV